MSTVITKEAIFIGMNLNFFLLTKISRKYCKLYKVIIFQLFINIPYHIPYLLIFSNDRMT